MKKNLAKDNIVDTIPKDGNEMLCGLNHIVNVGRMNAYTSVGCNRTPGCADWGEGGILFGASHGVGLLRVPFDGNAAKVLYTFVEHTKRVNTVKWVDVKHNQKQVHFISGSDDGLAILWNIDIRTQPKSYLLEGHTGGVQAVSGIWRRIQNCVLATASADSTVKVWEFCNAEIKCMQTISIASGGFCFALRTTCFPQSDKILLAFGCEDSSVSLYAELEEEENGQDPYKFLHKLRGHEDWVRGLDCIDDGDDLLIASSSQDNCIRLWRLTRCTGEEIKKKNDDLTQIWSGVGGEIRSEETNLHISENLWLTVNLESVLCGHEGWVYGVHWNNSEENGLQLLSSSIDKTLIIWAQTEDGVWMDKVRVGEVGGNSLGFFGGKFSINGKLIMGHSYQGGFHIWKQSEENTKIWTPHTTVSGHFGEVRDLAWESNGEFLITVSADQTTRIHALWYRSNEKMITWHEIARPQVHGYDMQAVALLSRYRFASGAEEKIVRTFQSPANFIRNFRNITSPMQDREGAILLEQLPRGASVPSLGLSNKAIHDIPGQGGEKRHVKDAYPENFFEPVILKAPPQEEMLMQNTLWPEVQKLYGHGFEIFSLAASPNGRVLASACRATSAEHAQIILWNTSTWKQIQKLAFHQLTVTQMRFSCDNRYLLSVSRDRLWGLFENLQLSNSDASPPFALVANSNKTNGIHARIIWSCDWSHDCKYFVTSSRDGKVVIWANSGRPVLDGDSLRGWYAQRVLDLKNQSITAVAFGAILSDPQDYLVAVGYETGLIQIFKYRRSGWNLVMNIDKNYGHHLAVKRLQFKPTPLDGLNNLFLASCGEDNFVRINNIYNLI